ncbi:MAG: hypothetical protein P4L84_16740 [Isosphaeraceae bacterium]|nr:hypothetical protein [Isosphaeraceae bacterium]
MASLVKQIDEKIGENGKLKSFVVITPKKGEKPADDLKTLAQEAGIQHVPLTVGESPDGPPDYEVAKDADVTILMWKGGKVQVNRAYKGALTADNVRSILNDIPKLLGD